MRSFSCAQFVVAFTFLGAGALSVLAQPAPLSTSFTYQGELASAGVPVDGLYDIRFRLYDDANRCLPG